MQIRAFEEKTCNPIVLCLGGFDSIHKGHKLLCDYANKIKTQYGANSAVFTYTNEFGKKDSGLVFTYEERLLRLENSQIDEVCVATFSTKFANLSPIDFLEKLVKMRSIKAFICGKDFKFGKNAQGDVGLLEQFCAKKHIPLFVLDFAFDEKGNKISTTLIKEYLKLGEIQKVNDLLGDSYFVKGLVLKGRQVGRTLGFPTANLAFERSKFLPKAGVYATHVLIDGRRYNAITNLGNAPTFNVKENLLECHIDGFNGDLYDKNLTVYFDKYIREIKKFDSLEGLIAQLNDDLKEIR